MIEHYCPLIRCTTSTFQILQSSFIKLYHFWVNSFLRQLEGSYNWLVPNIKPPNQVKAILNPWYTLNLKPCVLVSHKSFYVYLASVYIKDFNQWEILSLLMFKNAWVLQKILSLPLSWWKFSVQKGERNWKASNFFRPSRFPAKKETKTRKVSSFGEDNSFGKTKVQIKCNHG